MLILTAKIFDAQGTGRSILRSVQCMLCASNNDQWGFRCWPLKNLKSETKNLPCNPYLCRPFTNSGKWCSRWMNEISRFFSPKARHFKRKKIRLCQVKKEPISHINAAGNRCMVFVSVWKLPMAAKFYQHAAERAVRNWRFLTKEKRNKNLNPFKGFRKF